MQRRWDCTPVIKLPLVLGVAVEIGCLCLALGCSGRPPRVAAPAWDAERVALAAVTQYDQNGDGILATAEINASPALKAAVSTIDTDRNGQLTTEELSARLQLFGESRVGLIGPACQVRLNGAPLAGATVRLTPENFLTDVIEPAEGVTDETGMTVPSVPATSLPNANVRGIRLGFYRVEISREVSGREQVPPRYNTKTTLGLYVGPDAPDGFTFDLSR